MKQRMRLIIAFAALLMTASAQAGAPVEVVMSPIHFRLEGRSHSQASLFSRLKALDPSVINLQVCEPVPEKRLEAFVRELQTVHTGPIVVGRLARKALECVPPKSSPREA